MVPSDSRQAEFEKPQKSEVTGFSGTEKAIREAISTQEPFKV